MPRFITVLSVICVALATTHAHILSAHSPANVSILARREVDPARYDHPGYKQLVFAHSLQRVEDCPDGRLREHELDTRGIYHAPDKIIFLSCRDEGIFVDHWQFNIRDSCADEDIMQPHVTALTHWDMPLGMLHKNIDGKELDEVWEVKYEICIKEPSGQHKPQPEQPNEQQKPPQQPEQPEGNNPHPQILDSYGFKHLEAFFDTISRDPTCEDSILTYDHKLHPQKTSRSIDPVTIRTCRSNPIVVDNYKFTTTSECAGWDSTIPNVSMMVGLSDYGFITRNIGGVIHDVIDEVTVETCVTSTLSPDCWGEWIVNPTWDFEWQITVPMDYSQDKCGSKFEQAIKDACYPFEQTKFECDSLYPGALIRVRHSLLCGRSKMMKGLREGSGGGLGDMRCPYFVEIPVPSN
ncbi:hypothetical protein GE09DRAFT_1132673 [Coniochaeta sp. 2T2.1]|nr:hypothetical protein GE09DRAFT_1132673 [Coniochaeta sp. 2T2.1]